MKQWTRADRISVILCGLLLTMFVCIAWSVVQRESATADEPLHALAGFTRRFYSDFRLDTEHPPLWEYWAMLPHRRDELKLNFASPIWQQLPATFQNQPIWTMQTLYQTPGNDPIGFIQKSRAMMLAIAVLLGFSVSAWAWRLGGRAAGVIACALYSLDPNFIAHGPLVVNDVSMSLGLLAIAWAAWICGRRLSIGRSALLVLAVAATLNIKFSALLAGPLLVALLAVRCAQSSAWKTSRGALATPSQKCFAAAGLLAAVAVGCGIMVWLCYGLNWWPSADLSVNMNLDLLATAVKWTHLFVSSPAHVPPTPAQVVQSPTPLLVSMVLYANQIRILPQAFLAGFLHTLKTTQWSPSFLLGQIHSPGCWYYFPMAILFKTPLATLLSFAVAGVRLRVRKIWTAACLLLPLATLLGAAMLSNLNIGIRHILPIYPFLFIVTGVMLARYTSSSRGRLLLAMLGGLLVLELALTIPNELNFFNLACGGPRAGFKLLGDSNLDWGQDLPRLADWQRAHPDRTMYLCYFGMADSVYYVRSRPLLTDDLKPPSEPGVVAISATLLQGAYLQPRQVRFLQQLTAGRQAQLIGGSIYLFDTPGDAKQRIDGGSTRQ